jgi:hypothetical protein
MGRKERREREQKRENYATKRSSEQRRNMLIAVGILALIAVIVGYAAYVFATGLPSAPGGPENAGALGSEHSHAGILVKIFGDSFDFSAPAYQIKSAWIHFEGNDGTTIHKHATGVTLGYLFETLGLGLDDQCYEFQDGRSFCTNEDYSLKFFINGQHYGAETPEEIESQLLELEAQDLIK